MAVLEVLEYPNPLLKQKSEKVTKIDDALRQTLDDMLETMYDDNGCGLAAPQVGILKRMVVIDIAHEDEEPSPMFLINPEIIWRSETMVCGEEGCLSVPEMRAEVERFESVRIKYQDRDGKECELLAEGFLAIAVQHELDHLDGILYIDKISRLKRQMLLKKLEKNRKEKSEQ